VGWGFFLLVVVVLAAGLGYAGGRVALRTGRRPAVVEPPPPRRASFRLEHVDGMTWTLTNVGDAPGVLVRVLPFVDGLEQWPPQPVAGQLETATSELLPTLGPNGSMSVWFSRYDPGQRVIVSWTTEDEVRMGPVRLDVPPPR
jgi:hypothetical protein